MPVDSPRSPMYAETNFVDANLAVWSPSTKAFVRSRSPRECWSPCGGRLYCERYRRIAEPPPLGGVHRIFTIDLPLGDGNVHQVAIYCADWDSGGVRAQKIDVLDSASGAILDTRAMSKFVRGEYLV